jgi:hypothetical protein
MQFTQNTSTSRRRSSLMLLIKITLILAVITGVVIAISKIDFPSPYKEIEKIIPNEKLKIVK